MLSAQHGAREFFPLFFSSFPRAVYASRGTSCACGGVYKSVRRAWVAPFFACKVLKSPRLKRFSSLFVLAISVDIRRKLAIATVASVQWNLKLFNKKA